MPPIKFVIFSSAFFKLGNRCVVVYLKTNYTLKKKIGKSPIGPYTSSSVLTLPNPIQLLQLYIYHLSYP